MLWKSVCGVEFPSSTVKLTRFGGVVAVRRAEFLGPLGARSRRLASRDLPTLEKKGRQRGSMPELEWATVKRAPCGSPQPGAVSGAGRLPVITTLLTAVLAAQPAPGLSAETRAVLAPVAEAIAEVRTRHAALPPSKDDAEKLVRMGELDQAPRRVITTIDFSKVPAEERAAAVRAAGEMIEAVDHANQRALVGMLPPEGWFLRSRYGDKAAEAAFHIVQHSDVALWKRFLPVIETLVPKGEVAGRSYALMFDRLAVSEGRPQRFGSQFRCDNGRWRPYPLESPVKVDELRQSMSVGGSFAQMKARFEAMPPCPQTRSPPPPGMDTRN